VAARVAVGGYLVAEWVGPRLASGFGDHEQ